MTNRDSSATPPDVRPILTSPSDRLKLHFVDGIRGIAAFMVVCHHFVGPLVAGLPRILRLLLGWTQIGHFWVSVFIVISGYCLMIPVVRSPEKAIRGGYLRYFRRRALRIIPPYYCACILSIIVLVLSPAGFEWLHGRADGAWLANFSWDNLVSHLLLVHNLSPGWYDKLNIALWSVGTEWQIYFFFPFLLLPVWRRYGEGAAIGLGFVMGTVFPVLFPKQPILNIGCPWYLGLFAIGMVTASYGLDTEKRQRIDTRPLPVVMVLVLIIYALAKHYLPESLQPNNVYNYRFEWIKDALVGSFAGCLLVYLSRALSSHSHRGIKLLNALENRRLVGLGTFSYSLYLIHAAVLHLVQSAEAIWHISGMPQLVERICLGIPLSIACAYLFYCLVERRTLQPKS